MSARSLVCPELIGRDEEIGVLRNAVAALPAGGRVLLVGGEAGVGKSRLAGEAARLAEQAGSRVLAGHCREGADAPYAPLTAALRRHLRDLEEVAVRELFNGPAALAATLVPEAAALLGLERSADTTAEDLHAAVWHLLRRLGAAAPILLLIEDLHWAGPDTLRLLDHLTEEAPTLPLWLVATFRPDLPRRHPLTTTLVRWRRLPAVSDVRLRALGREELRRMLSALFAGTAVGDDFLDAVADRTGGNPFFVEELCAVLVDRGDIIEQQDGDYQRRELADIEMPETVRDTLLARVERLDGATVEVLRMAAVAGEVVEPGVLAHAAGERAADRALAAGLEHALLVERREGSLTRYVFRHALVRAALADDLHGPERERAHRRIAAALAEVHAADADAVAAEIADHLAAASDTRGAAQWSLRAARRAAAQHAPAAAQRHYQMALQLGEVDDRARLELLLEAAAATYDEDDTAPAGAHAREARALAARLGDVVAEADALNLLARVRLEAGDTRGSLACNEEAAELLRGRGDKAEAWALANVFRRLVTFGDAALAAERLPYALAVAERSGSDAALALLWNSRGILATDEDVEDAYSRAIHHAVAAGDRDLQAGAANTAGFVCAWRGHLRRSLEWMRVAVDIADALFVQRASYFHAGYAWALSLAGEYDAALEQAEPLGSSRSVPTRIVALHALVEVMLRRGQHEAAREHGEECLRLAEASGQGQRIDPALSHVARIRLREAADGADDIIERFLSRDWDCYTHAFVTPDLATALATRGVRGRLQRFLDEVRWRTERDPHRQNHAALAQCEAIAALARGDPSAGRDHAADALARCRAMPVPAREAECLLLLAEAEWQLGGGAACAEAVARALGIADRLHSGPLRDAALAARRRTEAEMVLATVLVTDIVGSTQRAADLGDRAWRALLERHHEIVRRELARHGGREIDTAGDGFIVSFDAPGRAIRCATAIVAALAEGEIPVRAGIHTGECEILGDKLAGIAVHVAARVAAVAAEGEVLMTGTVRDLVSGSGVVVDERGTHSLRGVPGDWALFKVVGSTRP